MKFLLLSSAAIAALTCSAAAPEIIEASFTQDENTHKATVEFTLGAESIVTLDIQTNGVSIGWRNYRDGITGCNFGKANPAGTYKLEWKPWTTWIDAPRKIPAGFVKAVITAWSKDNTPDFMDVDLTSKSNVTYYVSEDDLPHPVNSEIYKTTHLLMKRIHCANRLWTMGSPESEKGRATTEKLWENQRNVVLSQDYYIGVFETTQGQWKLMTGADLSSDIKTVDDAMPMCYRSYNNLRLTWEAGKTPTAWPELNHYVENHSDLGKARIKTGISFDLPTEAQWEYACRGGTVTAFNTGTNGDANGMIADEDLSRIARWLGNSVSEDGAVTNYTVVGSYDSNGFGLYDTVGNVAELCLDFRTTAANATFDPTANALVDPEGGVHAASAGASSVSARGSDFTSGNALLNWVNAYGVNVYMHRSAYRGSAFVGGNAQKEWIGFRLVAPVGAWSPLNSEVMDTPVQAEGSRIVKFKYDLDDDAIVTLKVLVDGEPVNGAASCVGGDVNRFVKAGEGKMISWYPDRSLEGLEIDSGRVKLKIEKWSIENPPAYMALGLTAPAMTNIAYYSEYELPGGATNDMFKTDWLLMRRIPAKDVVWWMGVATNAAGKSVEVGSARPAELRHLVKLSEDYFIGVFPLTERQLQLVDGTASTGEENLHKPALLTHHKVRPRSGGLWPQDKHSVSDSSILGVLRNRSGGYQFDLPTETQWEFACRALTGSAFCDGNIIGASYNGNTLANVTDYGWVEDNSQSVLMSVGLKLANGFGLYDMHGNAWEWCLDFFDEKYGLTADELQAAQVDPIKDPVGAKEKSWNANIVLKGGSASQSVTKARSADRTGYGYCDNIYTTGGSVGSTVRLVCPIVPVKE
jgi:formylglycine-generating enzyme required for sulfatase activity